MRKLFTMVALLVILGTAVSSAAQSLPAHPNGKLEAMRLRLNNREAKLQGWKNDAKSQISLAFTVGLLGLIVSALQGGKDGWFRILSVVLGLCVGAITLFTNIVYVADYHTLRRSVAQASRITENLETIVGNFDPGQNAENQTAVEVEFETQCGKFDQIEEKILGINPASAWITKQIGRIASNWGRVRASGFDSTALDFEKPSKR